MNKKKASEKGARIVLTLIGAFFLLWNLNTIGLYLFGEVTPAYNIDVSCTGRRDGSNVNTEYRYTISYDYTVNGKVQHSAASVRGPSLGPEYDKTVHYYPFAPNINSLFVESAFSASMILTVGFAVAAILFGVIPRKRKRMKAEYYHNGWDKNDPSWQCACGKWNTGNFCGGCGRPR